ncbi:MAG: hypothetical protein IPH84_13035 [Bacteroidales bacterium]|nr:hypothetical protein [Bacteroidales bacterium]
MNKFSFILICLTLSSVIVFAQNKFLPAYVIQNDGDTIKGYIEYKQWGQNPEKINFKADLLTQVEIFKPLDIKAFFVQNELYRSAIIFVKRVQTRP